jgi:hypothetical protein
VYRLEAAPTVRLDATTGTVNHDPDSRALFQVGKAKRSTATPTTEHMLAAFDNINLTVIPVAGQLHSQVTPLTAVQQRILDLWELSTTLYTILRIKTQGEVRLLLVWDC